MPDGAIGEDYSNLKALRTYARENAESWYTFISETWGWDTPNGSLYLVSGCDKSAAWGIMTLRTTQAKRSFSANFTATKIAGVNAGYNCSWSNTGDAIPRSSEASNLGIPQPQNQCLFVRGFKIMIRDGLDRRNNRNEPALESIMANSDADSLLRTKEFPDPSGNTSRTRSCFGGLFGGAKSQREANDGWTAERQLDSESGVGALFFLGNKSLNIF